MSQDQATPERNSPGTAPAPGRLSAARGRGPRKPGKPPERDVRAVFSVNARRQRYLDVEAALAGAQADAGLVPVEAAEQIAAAARLENLDESKLTVGRGHPLLPLIDELTRAAGPDAGKWVHWAASNEDIVQTGDIIGLRTAHRLLTGMVRDVLEILAEIGNRTADTVLPGRAHGQHAVPITFGYKVAAWSDVMIRHLERLRQLEPRLFTCMAAGSAGTFAAVGRRGPEIQEAVAQRLALGTMPVPARSVADHVAELVCVLGLVAATAGGIAEEITRLSSTEFGELAEPTAGSDGSTAQGHDPVLCASVVAAGAQVRTLVPLALEATVQAHEGDSARQAMMDRAAVQACVHTGDALKGLHAVLSGLQVRVRRMRENLDLTRGLVSADAVAASLAEKVGRPQAQLVVREAAEAMTGRGASFLEALLADERVREHLSGEQVDKLLEPTAYTGLSAVIAKESALRARTAAREL